jgi:hypothetical protein
MSSHTIYCHVKLARADGKSIQFDHALCGFVPGAVYQTAKGPKDYERIRRDCASPDSFPLCLECDEKMREHPANNITVETAYALRLSSWENLDLASLNNAVQMWGRVDEKNRAFSKALESDFIKPNGSLKAGNELKEACAYEVNRRVKEGLWK